MEKQLDAEVIVADDEPAADGRGGPPGAAAGRRRGLRLVELGLTRQASKVAARTLESLVPAAKLLVYRDNLDFFRSLDILVVAEKTSLVLKTRYGLKNLRIVHTRHGAGDRAIGFDKASAGFDHVLVSGAKIRDRLISEAGIAAEAISIVGYPEFDLAAAATRHADAG
ncbi:hypothetical protein ACRAWD_27250 [Caulobacter segnis]